jgi:hypothetical protein
MDLPEAAQNLSIIRDRFKDKLVVPMSAANGEGTKQFVQSFEQFLIR